MGVCNLTNIVAFAVLCVCFALLINAKNDNSCSGPKRYYEEMGCKPVFKTPDAQCPERYDCSHVENLPADKCFYNGYFYEIGEQPREEDRIPCKIGCTCSMKIGRQVLKRAEFFCPLILCGGQWWVMGPKPGCYEKRDAISCCSGPVVCPERDEDRPTCIVDGKKYRDGEYFQPAAEPDKVCYCGEGYNGENIEPFCRSPPTVCGIMLQRPDILSENCIPIYAYGKSPQTDCFQMMRCQNEKDAVIKRNDFHEFMSATNDLPDPEMQCKFGNLKMRVGDELNRSTWYTSICVKCVCEVPPVPTCKRLSAEACDVKRESKSLSLFSEI